MAHSTNDNKNKISQKTPPSLWKSIILIIIFTFGIVSLFAVIIFLLINGAQQMHRYLGERYNDGREWVLHYVTAREMYNIIRAAEDGNTGNPGSYRDYMIDPPVRE